jgi:cytochrome c oxidase subunit 1
MDATSVSFDLKIWNTQRHLLESIRLSSIRELATAGHKSGFGMCGAESTIMNRAFMFVEFITFLSSVKNCNHKGLGIYYLLSAFIFGIYGTLISVLIRIELYSSGNRIISPENQNFYNISITLHGFLMIFFLVMPGLFGGFGNYFVPIFQGSPEVVYPRVNNFSILILSLSYLFLILSLISEFGGGTGWTLYPPLSTSFMSLSPSSTGNLIFGLLISGISSCPPFLFLNCLDLIKDLSILSK